MELSFWKEAKQLGYRKQDYKLMTTLKRNHEPRFANQRGRNGRTLLHAAVKAGQAEAVAWLLEHTADPNLAEDSQVGRAHGMSCHSPGV